MSPDWPTLFAPRPLADRALRLQIELPAPPVWFAVTQSADLAELPPAQFLTPTEVIRANAFKFPPPRAHFALGRLAAKLALAAITGETRLAQLEIQNGEQGEPVVTQPPQSGFGVSLSHGDGWAVAVAFPQTFPVGIDLETIDPARTASALAGLEWSAGEKTWISASGLEAAPARVLLWSAREALGKLRGSGLSCPWEELAVSRIEPAGPGRWTCRYQHQPACRGFAWLHGSQVLTLACRVRPEAPGVI